MTRCKSCHASIWFVPTASSMMPVDLPEVRLADVGASQRYVVVKRANGIAEVIGGEVVNAQASTWSWPHIYTPHWATCTNADAHRKGKS